MPTPTSALALSQSSTSGPVAHFADHGIDRIEQPMTDSAWSYRHGAFIKPHCPWQNGKVERLNRTLRTEWAYRQVFTTNDEGAAALAPRLHYHDHRRRRSANGGLPPISRLSPT